MVDRFRNVEYDLVKQIWRNSGDSEDKLEGFWAFRNSLLTIDGMARAHGAKALVVTPFWSFRSNDRKKLFATKIMAAAEEDGLPVLDAATLLPVGDVSLMVDDVHFSPKGSRIFAGLLADFIIDKGLLLHTALTNTK